MLSRKANRLEFYELNVTDDGSLGLELRYTRAIYGKVTMLEKIHPTKSPTDHLFVGTDRHTYFTLSWDAAQKQLRTEKSYVDLSDKTGRDSQSADRAMIDPMRRFLTLELFEGTLTIVPLIQRTKKNAIAQTESLGEPAQLRIAEMFIRSSTYLYSPIAGQKGDKSRLVLLYEDSQQGVKLQVKSIDFTKGSGSELGIDIEDQSDPKDDIDSSASHLIPVPGPSCQCHSTLVLNMLTKHSRIYSPCRDLHNLFQ